MNIFNYLKHLLTKFVRKSPKSKRPRLGEILVKSGKLEPGDIEEALQEQRKRDCMFIERETYGIRIHLFLSNRTLVAIVGIFTSGMALAWKYVAKFLQALR